MMWAHTRVTRAVASLGLAAALLTSCLGEPPQKTFSPAEWQQASAGSDARYAMAKDIVSRRLLVGRSLAEVEATLGAGHFQETTRWATYRLGGPTRFGLGNYLVIEFSPDGKVDRTFIYRE